MRGQTPTAGHRQAVGRFESVSRWNFSCRDTQRFSQLLHGAQPTQRQSRFERRLQRNRFGTTSVLLWH